MRDYLLGLATDKRSGFWPSVLKILLSLLSFVYAILLRILRFWRQLNRVCLGCKVISVGNISLGGTGKTPLVEYIALYLRNSGHKVAVLSRGYKRKVKSQCKAKRSLPEGEKSKVKSYENAGDEAYMLSCNLKDIPVIVDVNRARAASKAIKEYGVDTVILDDAFQQWHIKKDLEIVTIDATNPFGNKKIIPRGILREPLSALKRADIFMLTKADLILGTQKIKDLLVRINPRADIFESVHRPIGFYEITNPKELIPLEYLKGKKAVIFSGIGDPASLEKLISRLGLNIMFSLRFPDHHNYTHEDLEKVLKAAQDKGADIIITTQKDSVRLSSLWSPPPPRLRRTSMVYGLKFLVLRIELTIKENEERFRSRLLRVRSF